MKYIIIKIKYDNFFLNEIYKLYYFNYNILRIILNFSNSIIRY